jgi:integrase/recombinase XerC
VLRTPVAVTNVICMINPLIRSWLLAREAENVSPKTIKVYRAAVQDFAASLDGRSLTDANRDDVRLWIKGLRPVDGGERDNAPCSCYRGRPHTVAKHGLAPATVRLWFSTLRQFYRWVIAEGDEGVTKNPTENIAVPALSDDIPTPTLTMAQVRDLLAVPGSSFLARRDAALFHVMVDGGLRRGEVQGLQVSDVDLDDGGVYVQGKRTNRAERNRITQLGIRSRQAVDRYLRARAARPYASDSALWLSSWGDGVLTHSGFQAIFERHGKRIGVHLHPHMLRHTWASQFRRTGGSEGDLLVLGGWSSRSMLDRYGKADAADRAREAYRRLSVTDKLR